MTRRLEQDLDARGKVFVILAFDLSAFVASDSQETLMRLRCHARFDEFLRQWRLNDPRFTRDDCYVETEHRGYEIGVFNRILAEDRFAPTYRLNKNKVHFPKELEHNVQFKDKFLKLWRKWDFWIRLCSNGIVTLILCLDIAKPKKLIDISRDVIGLQGHFDIESARRKLRELEADGQSIGALERIASIHQFMQWSSQHSMADIERESPPVLWQMAAEVMRQFGEACAFRLHSTAQNLQFSLELTPFPSGGTLGVLREELTLYHFFEIGDYDFDTKTRNILSPSTIACDEYAQTISGLLEGVILEGKSTYYYPTHSLDYARAIVSRNQSTWENEICVFTGPSALIYRYTPKETKVIFPSGYISHAEYWDTIARGIEFSVETRLLAQVVEQIAAHYLSEAIPLLGDNHDLDKKSLGRMNERVANISRYIAYLRTITTPHLIAYAPYATGKFELLLSQSGITDILDHAEANLGDLQALLARDHEMLLQLESQRLGELALAFSVIFASLTVSLSVLALPAFIQAWEAEGRSFLSARWYYPFLGWAGEDLVGFTVLLGILAFAAGILAFVVARRRRKPRLF